MTPTPEELARREEMRDPEIFHRWATSYDWRSVMDALAASQERVGDLEAIIDYLEGGPGESARAWVAMQEIGRAYV